MRHKSTELKTIKFFNYVMILTNIFDLSTAGRIFFIAQLKNNKVIQL